jgi:hypothetical protein
VADPDAAGREDVREEPAEECSRRQGRGAAVLGPKRHGVVSPPAVTIQVASGPESDRTWPYSFESLCETVGLDAAYLRRGIRAVRGVAA